MKSIRLVNIKKSYKGEIVFENINLTIPGGQFFALLGPSGCGKTTILRNIGGFEPVDGGSIYLGDQDITHMPINERPVNTVFQNYALFPHLNVFENVAYSLSVRGVAKKTIRNRVEAILRSVHLEKQIHKSISQLSGGQKQRVALARAVINEPEVLLLDEPLAALDMKLREKMLIELIDLQAKIKTTFIYVTHDQVEALTLADQMAIMNSNGVIEQIGTPKEIYEDPATTFVARFVGTTNIFTGTLVKQENGWCLDVLDLGLIPVSQPSVKAWVVDGRQAFLSVRPEKIWISALPSEGFSIHMKGVVESIVYHGRSTQYNVRLSNGHLIHVFHQNEEHFPREVLDYESKVNVYWQKENSVLLER